MMCTQQRNKKGFTLVEIMIVVAIIALLAAIAIPNLLRARMTSNDALAKATIRAISTAAESFATANNGTFPTSEADLTTNSNPPYLNTSYCNKTISGFTYTCNFAATSYSVTAAPTTTGSTGSKNFIIATGGVLTES